MANNPEKTTPPPGSRVDHMANERTFLAWIRTSIGIMAFGFVVEKFSLFLKQISYFFAAQGVSESAGLSIHHQSYSSIFGIFLVGFGALLGFLAFIKFRKTERQIAENNYTFSTTLPTVLTALVVMMGVFLVLYLITT